MAYFSTGYIGLLLAAPPGFATAVWPASGIALGWVLLFGWRLLPGVVLGSFAANLTISIRASGAGLFEVGWTIPMLIAMGAALQAGIGARLVRRWAGFPSGLDEPWVVLKTLSLGGLLATVINASWSVTLLTQTGVIPAGRWVQNWLTWWMGDSIGVLVFTPLILVWGVRKPYFHHRRALAVTLVLIAAFSATVLGFLLVAKLEAEDRIGRFQASGTLAVSQFIRGFAEYESFANQMRGLFDSQGEVSRTGFSVFAKEWTDKHPEVRGAQWAPHIAQADRAGFEAQLTDFIGQPVRIQDIGRSGQQADERPEYVPLFYVEPLAPDRSILGFDIFSEANRRKTLLTAALSGEPLMTPPVTLIEDKQPRSAVLLYTPVYRGLEHHGQGWADTRGFVVLVLKMDAVLAGLTHDILPEGLRMVVVDQPTGAILSGQRPDARTLNLAQRMKLQYKVSDRFGQRSWQLEVWPTASYLNHYESWLTWTVLVIGLLGASAAVSFTLITSGRRQQLERAVLTRTQELTDRNAELELARQKALEANRALEAARSEAVEASLAKGQFLANMSHEIRTPMNAIIGFTQLLLRNGFKGKSQEYLNHIHNASRSLLELLNDILDFSKIEAGKMELHEVSFKLDEVMRSAVQQIMLPATAKGLEIVLDIAPDVPLNLRGDSLRLGQILLNLCNNAVKFTEQGDIVVGVDLDGSSAGTQASLHFWVKDSGIGIEPERVQRLFGLFVQADSSITRKYGGTGLGLAICARLVNLMGGAIEVESTQGQGSLFHFTLPLTVDRSVQDAYALNSRLPVDKLRVLVVDDSATARTILSSQLRQMAFRVALAASGEEGLQQIIRAAWDEPFDLVLLDWHMPGWDGIETARRIWQEPTLARVPPLFLVTGHAHALQQRELQGIHFAACLPKPVTASALQAAILNEFGGLKVDRPPAPRALLQFAPAWILLVEDNPANQMLASEMLRQLGLQVDVAANGREGVAAALKQPDADKPPYALVLMDLQMPVMDGFEAAARIRERFTAAVLPVVAMTAYAMPADRQRCLGIGMNAHLAKPVDIQVLAALLARFLPLATTVAESPPPSAAQAPSVAETAGLALAVRDFERLLARQSFDARLVFDQWQSLLAGQFPTETAELAGRLQRLDFPGARLVLAAIALKIPLD